jgi:hypothetical protein
VQKDAVTLNNLRNWKSVAQNRMEGRNLGRSRPETARNAVGEGIMPPQAQQYIGVYMPIKVLQQTPSSLVCKRAPTDDTLYVPPIAATGI